MHWRRDNVESVVVNQRSIEFQTRGNKQYLQCGSHIKRADFLYKPCSKQPLVFVDAHSQAIWLLFCTDNTSFQTNIRALSKRIKHGSKFVYHDAKSHCAKGINDMRSLEYLSMFSINVRFLR